MNLKPQFSYQELRTTRMRTFPAKQFNSRSPRPCSALLKSGKYTSIDTPSFNRGLGREQRGLGSRTLQNRRTDATHSAAYIGELATYRLPERTSVPSWFSDAIREAVRHLESSPFLQLVRFHDNKTPKFSSFSVDQSVVATPELWSSIAETISSDTADVCILVQRVDRPPSDAVLSNKIQDPSPQKNENNTTLNSEMRQHVEDACRQLVHSGIGTSILYGHVGECCDNNNKNKTHDEPTENFDGIVNTTTQDAITENATIKELSSVTASGITAEIVSPHSRSAYLSSPSLSSKSSSLSGYWGVVVQSRHHTGAEGCYLLKAIRTAGHFPGDCSCTHFSLTRVCQGENLEKQFVQSWLV